MCSKIWGVLALFFAHALALSGCWFSSTAQIGRSALPSLTCLPCSLDSGCRISRERAIEALVNLRNGFVVQDQLVLLCCLKPEPKPRRFILTGTIGVCGLLALPNIHQSFGDYPAKFPRLAACRGVGFLLLKVVCSGCVAGGNVGHGSLRTNFWGTQWGQLNRSFALSLLLALIERRSGSLRRLLAWYNSLP